MIPGVPGYPWRMKLAYTQTYPAPPERVVALLRTPDFLDDLAKHAGALEHTVKVSDDGAMLGMKLPVPQHLTRFVGESLQLNQTFRFQAPRADGTIPGTVEVDVPGMPVVTSATAELAPSGNATLARYLGELKVRIPLVGKKVEEQVEPFIRDAFDGLERRATDWLTR